MITVNSLTQKYIFMVTGNIRILIQMSWMTRPNVEILVVQLYYPRKHDNRVLAIEIFLQITNAGEIVARKKTKWELLLQNR